MTPITSASGAVRRSAQFNAPALKPGTTHEAELEARPELRAALSDRFDGEISDLYAFQKRAQVERNSDSRRQRRDQACKDQAFLLPKRARFEGCRQLCAPAPLPIQDCHSPHRMA